MTVPELIDAGFKPGALGHLLFHSPLSRIVQLASNPFTDRDQTYIMIRMVPGERTTNKQVSVDDVTVIPDPFQPSNRFFTHRALASNLVDCFLSVELMHKEKCAPIDAKQTSSLYEYRPEIQDWGPVIQPALTVVQVYQVGNTKRPGWCPAIWNASGWCLSFATTTEYKVKQQ